MRDLDAARAFYRDTLGFEETFVDFEDGWRVSRRGAMEIAVAEGDPAESSGVAHVDART